MKRKLRLGSILAFSLLVVTCKVAKNTSTPTQVSTKPGADYSVKPVVNLNPNPAVLTPEQSLNSFRVPKGYHMELVASDPMIHEPVAIAWDGNARMYVAEMDTYMQNVDGANEFEATSRVMLLEDTNGDGKMDKSSVFIDKMMLPRMMVCVNHELLVNQTDTFDIFSYKDTNGDGVADEKKALYQVKERAPGNLEHQHSGLMWNMDNWMYLTVDPVRFRYTNGQFKVDSIPSGSGGQWGVTSDNYGRIFMSRAGAEIPAAGFQINPMYGILDPKEQFNDEFSAVWPIISTPDAQGGPRRLRPADSTLNHFTASCGQVIYRGDKLPQDLVGDYLVAEPVARIIRRAKVTNKGGRLYLENAYNQQEFIASTDFNFRPVNMYTGPDGCLYIVDMNRGIIQEGQWTGPNTYVRNQIYRLGLDKHVQHGRIWRLVQDGVKPGPKPNMLNEPVNKLVTYLDHPNGWWRDNAQKQIIVLGDKSVVPALKQIALGQQGPLAKKPSDVAQVHALWTLEGLEAIDKELLFSAMKDTHPEVRKAAVWISEMYIKKNDDQVLAKLGELQADASPNVRIQLLASLTSYSESDKSKAITKAILDAQPGNDVLASVKSSLDKNEAVKRFGTSLGNMAPADRALVTSGANTFKSLCATCHGADGKGLSSQIAPPLVGSKRINDKDVVTKILLHGLAGPIDGKTYPDMMPAMGANDDEWLASVLTYIRYTFGTRGGFPGAAPRPAGAAPTITQNASGSNGGLARVNGLPQGLMIGTPTMVPAIRADEVKKIREQTAGRTKNWTVAELEAPKP